MKNNSYYVISLYLSGTNINRKKILILYESDFLFVVKDLFALKIHKI